MIRKKWILGASGAGAVLIALMLLRGNLSEESKRQPMVKPNDIDLSGIAAGGNISAKPQSSGEAPPPADLAASEASTQNYAEQRAAFLQKVEPLFGSEEKGRWILYRMVVETLGKDSVPFLRELLLDESYKGRWDQIALMIAMVSDKTDRESVSAILAFIRRPNTWPADDRNSIISHTVGIGGVLKNLGHFESDLVKETLQDALTEEGAEDLIGAWINVQTTVEPPYLIMIIRSWAAKGLVLTRDPENITLVKESYEALAHKMLTVEYRQKEMTSELWLESELLLAYAGGMTENDMLADMGVDEFMRLRDDSHTWAMVNSRYSSKYQGKKLDDERRIMKACPICGKVAE